LLYQTRVDPLKVMGRIFNITSPSWMIKSRLLCIFWTCSHGSVKLLSCLKLFLWRYTFLEMKVCKTYLEVVKHLKRVLTISSDIFMIFYESYNHFLTLTEQITFNVRNSLVWPHYFSFMTIISNNCLSMIDFHDIHLF
jgi:hypothetical protein